MTDGSILNAGEAPGGGSTVLAGVALGVSAVALIGAAVLLVLLFKKRTMGF
jgi:hypothetical protein